MTEREKVDPSTLELRPKPRPVTRLNKNALMLAAGAAQATIKASTTNVDKMTNNLFRIQFSPSSLKTESQIWTMAQTGKKGAPWTAVQRRMRIQD